MKHKFYYVTLVLTGFIFLSACEKDDEGENTNLNTTDYSLLISDYAENTVIATYADMKNNAIIMYSAVEAFKSSGSQNDLDDACQGWKGTRAPWESSEAFLFGPAAYHSLDPLLDSWPLDQAQLDQVLAGTQELSAEFVRDGLGAVLRGFHTTEYLLFRDGQNRSVGDFTEREREYLVAVSQVLRDDCITLWALWNGVEEATLEAEVLEKLGIEIKVPYVQEFMAAGKAGSRYISQRDAVDEIIQGIMDIAEEVGTGKLADPYTTKDVLVVESWHSWNSLTDFKNNIRSIENAYTSSYNGVSAESSLSKYVAEKDADLDAEVKAKITAAIAALNNINEPYRNNLNDDVNIPAAMAAINEVFDIFELQVGKTVLE